MVPKSTHWVVLPPTSLGVFHGTWSELQALLKNRRGTYVQGFPTSEIAETFYTLHSHVVVSQADVPTGYYCDGSCREKKVGYGVCHYDSASG